MAKDSEHHDRAGDGRPSEPRSEGGWQHADRVGRGAATLGFDWDCPSGPLAKVREEADEIRQVLESTSADRSARLEEEIGDLLFAISGLCRHCNVEPARALAGAVAKFERRFTAVEAAIRNGRAANLEAMETVWQQTKARGRNS